MDESASELKHGWKGKSSDDNKIVLFPANLTLTRSDFQSSNQENPSSNVCFKLMAVCLGQEWKGSEVGGSWARIKTHILMARTWLCVWLGI